MNPENPVVRLCARGMRAEAEGRADEAAGLFLRAWEAAEDDYEACVAAHYLARHQPTAEETLRWNQECLDRADRVGDERVRPFYPSLHGTMGRAWLDLGDAVRARAHFEAAAARLDDLPPGQYAEWLRLCVARGLRATAWETAADEPLRALLERLCARADLDSLGLLLPAYLGGLGRPEDAERLTAALRMLHSERRLPEAEQSALGEAIAQREAG
ncbi:hypothetical protein GCM10010387_24570 [Streptomyces inusitatus]|uniref:Tetratricopeptide repeat protein n=1 Tax=Streptomyces inusitatus TaxID=68221 RepID=A0A918Q108_9ACTN|nr:hypothetical protein [Streptomyces inusitatus]GGZ30136.1 hypothetical protein GCM10010387_24570 [Streptomyces inusitatus]